MKFKWKINKTFQNLIKYPHYLKKLLPVGKDITVLGIHPGGSRLLDIEIPGSDYDLDIIISNEDYLKITPEDLQRTLKVEGKSVHCYYTPIDPKKLDLEKVFFVKEWFICLAFKKLSIEDFIIVNDEEKLNEYINNVNSKENLRYFKEAFKQDTYGLTYIKNIIDNDLYFEYMNHRWYYYLYLSAMLNNNLSKMQPKIKEVRTQLFDILFTKVPPEKIISPTTKRYISDSLRTVANWLQSEGTE